MPMRLAIQLLSLAVLLLASPGLSLTPYLVKDINQIPTPESSNPNWFVTLGSVSLFRADDGISGEELWRSDGTAAGTYQLVDACTGECDGKPYLVPAGRVLFFFTFDPGIATSLSLWITDGTEAGTFRLHQGFREVGWPFWAKGRGILYFPANNGVHGLELWRSDGTPGGTFQVEDIRPGAGSSGPGNFRLDGFVEVGSHVFFSADDGIRGPALWKSDGTQGSAELVKDLSPSSTSPSTAPRNLQTLGNRLFFVGPSPAGEELWRSDGTAAGTVLAVDLEPGPGSPRFFNFFIFKNRLFFGASTSRKGQELWTTNGTPRGTWTVTNFRQAEAFVTPTFYAPPYPAMFGDRFLFSSYSGPQGQGQQLWVSDGTLAGTSLFPAICAGSCPGPFLFDRAVQGGRMYFKADNGVHGQELWVTDGTSAGTRMVRDLCRGSCSSSPTELVFLKDRLLFIAWRQGKPSIWVTDGTSRGTSLVAELARNESITEDFFADPVQGATLFSISDPLHGKELWRTDGTPEGTYLLRDIAEADLGGSGPRRFQALGESLLFWADDGQHGTELWKSDGTDTGTSMVHEFTPGPESSRDSSQSYSVEVGGKLFVLERNGDPPLWVTDGTDAGTLLLSSSEVRPQFSGLAVLNREVFFVAADSSYEQGLWKTDGTVGGTRLVKALGREQIGDLAASGGRVFFSCDSPDGQEGRELWSSDGTPQGTALVKDIHPWTNTGSNPWLLTEHAGRLYFFANDEEHGAELWRSDGTATGTVLVAELAPGAGSFTPFQMVSLAGKLWISGSTTPGEAGLWVSDGTAEGTRRIGQTWMLPDRNRLLRPAVIGNEVFFAGLTTPNEAALWKSDGTEAGTRPVRDRDGQLVLWPRSLLVFENRLVFTTFAWPGRFHVWESNGTDAGTSVLLTFTTPSSEPSELIRVGRRIFFRSYDRTSGSELWALRPD